MVPLNLRRGLNSDKGKTKKYRHIGSIFVYMIERNLRDPPV